jgi:uncharacterized protein YggT (Ycf19 family)
MSANQNSADTARDSAREKIDQEVARELERESSLSGSKEREEVRSVAHELKSKSISEVRESEHDAGRARKYRRFYQFIDYAFYLIYGIIGLMIGLELLGARDWTAFMRVMRTVTTPLLGPFRGVMPDPAVGSSQLMLSYILALVVYVLLHKAIKGLFRLLVDRDGADL